MHISSISLQNTPARYFYVMCVVTVMAVQCGEISFLTEIFVEGIHLSWTAGIEVPVGFASDHRVLSTAL